MCLKDSDITTRFEIDHFIPEEAFKNIRDDLKTDYRNLVYACKKCNNYKGAKFRGDLHSENPRNEMFYDPATTDYNKIFYRNEFGAIASDDEKGKQQIRELKLYLPIHNLAWICEELYEVAERLRIAKEKETDTHKKEVYEKLYNKANEKLRMRKAAFLALYNDKAED